MRWYSHKVTTASLVYAVTGGDLPATAAAMAGSIAPDAIEITACGLIPHRTITHWPYPYLVVALGLWLLSLTQTSGLVAWYAMFFPIGALLHLAEDALSKSGIPLRGPFGKRTGLGTYKTFSLFSEQAVVLAIIIPCFAVSAWTGKISFDHFQLETRRIFLLGEYFGNWLGSLV